MYKKKFEVFALALSVIFMASTNLDAGAQCGNAGSEKPQKRELRAKISKAQPSAQAESWKRLESARAAANPASSSESNSRDDNYRRRFAEQFDGRRPPPPPPWSAYAGAGMRPSGSRCSSCGQSTAFGAHNADNERPPEGMSQQSGFRPPPGDFRHPRREQGGEQENLPPPPHGFGPMEGMPPPPFAFGPQGGMPPAMQE